MVNKKNRIDSIPPKERVEVELKQYYPVICKVVKSAVDEVIYSENIHKQTESSIAANITNTIIYDLQNEFEENHSVSMKYIANTKMFRIGDLLLRVKKLNSNKNASYNHTPTSIDYTDQSDIFDGEYTLGKLHLGYRLNPFGTLEDVIITCPINGGKSNAWFISLSKSDGIQYEEAQRTFEFKATKDKRLKAKSTSSTESDSAKNSA